MERKYTITLSVTADHVFSLFTSAQIDSMYASYRLTEAQKNGDLNEVKVQKTRLEVCEIILDALKGVNLNEHL